MPFLNSSTFKKVIPICLAALWLVRCQAPTTRQTPAADSAPDSGLHLRDSVARSPLKEAFFGETHIHTSSSMDAYIGSNRISPEEAYRFATGEAVKINGSLHQLKRPLDFCAITDHAEYLGETYTLLNPGTPGYEDTVASQMRNAANREEASRLFLKYVVTPARTGGKIHPSFYQGPASTEAGWRKNFQATEKYYRPGTFTTLHGFEWSAAPNGGNLHRNVLFRDSIVPKLPFSANESRDPEKLWEWMDQIRQSGSTVLAIPHNSNGSKTLMFSDTTLSGKPLNAEYAKRRQENEPSIEMMQIKGNSEVHPNFWSNDEFASFENANSLANYSGRVLDKRNYVRYGLEHGLQLEEELGVNPFKYGFVGGTDNHNGAPGDVEEDGYSVGSHGWADRTARDRASKDIDGWATAFDVNPGALTGVWAGANTRSEIWDGIKRKETFATSGPRMKVRVFAGYGFQAAYSSYEQLVKDGYAKGVPMGGDLKSDASQKSPQLLVWAIKDPLGPGLDRIQVIKGWIEKGQVKEKIYNVAASDGRKIDAAGKVIALKAPVNLKTGAYDSTQGSVELKAVWTDPDFNQGVRCFYYVRVLQVPTGRWSLFDEIREGVKFPAQVPKTVVERAWASPIWYSPKK